MLTRVGLVVVAIAGVLAGCAAPPPAEPVVDIAAEAQTIRDLSAMWLEAAKVRDGATIDGLFAADATTIFDGEVYQGLASIRAARELEWASEPQGEFDWATTSVVVAASGDLAIERGQWTERDLEEDEADVGEYVTVWTKIGGQWKVMVDAGTELEDEVEGEEMNIDD